MNLIDAMSKIYTIRIYFLTILGVLDLEGLRFEMTPGHPSGLRRWRTAWHLDMLANVIDH